MAARIGVRVDIESARRIAVHAQQLDGLYRDGKLNVEEAQKLVKDWVTEIAELCKPDSVHWCDGSQEEWDRLTAELVAAGTLKPLNATKRPNSFYAASDPRDVARVESRRKSCSVRMWAPGTFSEKASRKSTAIGARLARLSRPPLACSPPAGKQARALSKWSMACRESPGDMPALRSALYPILRSAAYVPPPA